jgi:AcrR family transcriptional regulator
LSAIWPTENARRGRIGMARVCGVNTDNILDIAESVLLNKGLRNASLSDIANAAGISKGTLYYYFASKDLLIFSVAMRYFDRANALMEEWMSTIRSPDMSEDALRLVLENVIGDERTARIMLFLTQDAAFGNTRLKEKFILRYNDWKKTLSDAIGRLFGKDEKQCALFSELLISVMEGFSMRVALSQRLPDCSGLARALSAALACT